MRLSGSSFRWPRPTRQWSADPGRAHTQLSRLHRTGERCAAGPGNLQRGQSYVLEPRSSTSAAGPPDQCGAAIGHLASNRQGCRPSPRPAETPRLHSVVLPNVQRLPKTRSIPRRRTSTATTPWLTTAPEWGVLPMSRLSEFQSDRHTRFVLRPEKCGFVGSRSM